MQVLTDEHCNVVYLNWRKCSIHGRNQKVYKEAPALCVSPELRCRMSQQACELAAHVEYVRHRRQVRAPGGQEPRLLSPQKLNTRLRMHVRHPVAEFITVAMAQADVRVDG